MCRRHWFMVPGELRAAVLKHYRRGQCGWAQGDGSDRPSDAWLAAARAGIEAVAGKEGR